ncbi:MAG: hypothetical protein K5770_15055 [Lachnospiraceae bacterium]|nr:hypothetical protein [Lachnospiraceae bacterium]
MDDKKEKRGIPEKSVVTIRLLVGCYLLYIDYSVIQNIGNYEGGQKAAIIAFLILFLVVGLYFVVVGCKYLMKDWRQEREAAKAEEAERKTVTPERSLSEKAAILNGPLDDTDIQESQSNSGSDLKDQIEQENAVYSENPED